MNKTETNRQTEKRDKETLIEFSFLRKHISSLMTHFSFCVFVNSEKKNCFFRKNSFQFVLHWYSSLITIKLVEIEPFNMITLKRWSISIKDFVPEKKHNRKKERATEALNLKLNTKPLKFKCGLADGGGGGGLVDPCKAWVPPPSNKIIG